MQHHLEDLSHPKVEMVNLLPIVLALLHVEVVHFVIRYFLQVSCDIYDLLRRKGKRFE